MAGNNKYLLIYFTSGVTTHIDIAYRTLSYLKTYNGNATIIQWIKDNPESFEAGSFFPDWYYEIILNITGDMHVRDLTTYPNKVNIITFILP